jgi:hypothetical protein
MRRSVKRAERYSDQQWHDMIAAPLAGDRNGEKDADRLVRRADHALQ